MLLVKTHTNRIWNDSILPYMIPFYLARSQKLPLTVIDCLQLQGAKYRRTSSSYNGYEPIWKAVFLALYSTRPRKLHWWSLMSWKTKRPPRGHLFQCCVTHLSQVISCSRILDLDVVLLPFICSDISSLWHGQQNSSMHLSLSSTPSLSE